MMVAATKHVWWKKEAAKSKVTLKLSLFFLGHTRTHPHTHSHTQRREGALPPGIETASPH